MSQTVYFLTYNLSIRAKDGCVLSDRRAGGNQTDSLPGCLGFDLRYDDISAREIFGLTPALSCEREAKTMEPTVYQTELKSRCAQKHERKPKFLFKVLF